jgi:tetratricopeptide (TPR) repeat protein
MRGKTGTSNQWNVMLNGVALLVTLFTGIASAQNPPQNSPQNPVSSAAAVSSVAARNNEALQLVREGRDKEAEELYRAAWAASDDDLTRAKIASNLGELYRRQDRYSEAEHMYRSALQWRQKNLPAESIEVAYSLNNLGEIFRVEGRDWEARNLMETAARNLQQFHADAPGLPIILSNLSVMLCRFGEFERAEEFLRFALICYEKRQATLSHEYAVTLTNLGQVLAAKNELNAAALLYEQAIGILEHVDPPAKSALAGALANAGELYERMGRCDEARQAEERALNLLNPAGDVLLHAQILQNLGNIVASSGKPADSVPYFEQSLMIHEKTLGAEHPATASLLLDYASASQRAGNKSLSRKLRKRAQDLLARLRRQSSSQMTVSLRDLREDH